jgi:galactokinase
LSSSAALEMSFLEALKEAFQLKIGEITLAEIGQRIENDFVGARVGIMDQMACSLAKDDEALFLDTKKMTYERIPIPVDKFDLVVINSGLKHQHAGGDYNQRRSECEQACHWLGISQLRELSMKDLPRLDKLPDLLKRRARHVITENQRVHDSVDALRSGDIKKLGQLFCESHVSMRDDYQVSLKEIDLLVQMCCEHPATYGARLTGGGFGGSIVALTQKGTGSAVAHEVVQKFQIRTHLPASVLVP